MNAGLHLLNKGVTSRAFPCSGIRLAGATNDVHIFDVRTGRWEKTTPAGEPPSPRAAHAAAAVGNMVVIQVRGAHHTGRLQTLASSRLQTRFHWRNCREASAQRVWRRKTCMSWTSPTLSAHAGTGNYCRFGLTFEAPFWFLYSRCLNFLGFSGCSCRGRARVLGMRILSAWSQTGSSWPWAGTMASQRSGTRGPWTRQRSLTHGGKLPTRARCPRPGTVATSRRAY